MGAYNLTYYVGAGASANAIPVVGKLYDDLLSFKSEIANSFKISDSPLSRPDTEIRLTANEAKNRLISDLEWLITEAKKYSTIDTFAKKILPRLVHNTLL